MIAFVASDLIWASRIKATADAAGVPAKRVFNPAGLADLIETGAVRLILIDLESEDAEAVIGAIRGPAASERARATPALAWAPHVLVDRMEAARAAGVERVVPRGAFSTRLESIVAEAAGG